MREALLRMRTDKGEGYLFERQNDHVMQSDTSDTANNASLFDRLLDMNNLFEAFKRCRKQTYWKHSVQAYESNLLFNLCALRKSLIDGTYRQKPFVEFDLNERGKIRHIKAMHISDRVLQRALCDYVLEPCMRKYLIYDNGASLKGKGIDFTKRRLVAHLCKYYQKHGNHGYILLCDISKYFDSIPHDRLVALFRKYIKDEKVMVLVSYIISMFGGDAGVGIGVQLAQIAGVSYLKTVDNYVKIVRGCKYYGRYMDDFYIIHNDKQFLKDLLVEIDGILTGLGLTLNRRKTHIYRIDKGFIFLKLKTRITSTGKVVRIPCRKNIIREKRKLRKLKRKGVEFRDVYTSYLSFRGNIRRYNSYRIVNSLDRYFSSIYGEEMENISVGERYGRKNQRTGE